MLSPGDREFADRLERVLRSERGPELASLIIRRAVSSAAKVRRDQAQMAEVDRVIDAVADEFSVLPERQAGRGRGPTETLARRVVMYLCVTRMRLSYRSAAKHFGRTKNFAREAFMDIQDRLAQDEQLQVRVGRVVARLEAEEMVRDECAA